MGWRLLRLQYLVLCCHGDVDPRHSPHQPLSDNNVTNVITCYPRSVNTYAASFLKSNNLFAIHI